MLEVIVLFTTSFFAFPRTRFLALLIFWHLFHLTLLNILILTKKVENANKIANFGKVILGDIMHEINLDKYELRTDLVIDHFPGEESCSNYTKR